MVKSSDLYRLLGGAIDFVDAILEADIIVPGYTENEIEDFREELCDKWADLEDGEIVIGM